MVIDRIVSYKQKDRFEIDPEILKAYPNCHPFWSLNTPEKIMSREADGYFVVPAPASWKIKFKGTSLENMNTVVVKDRILMMCSKKQYKDGQDEKEDYRKAMELNSKSYSDVKSKIESIGTKNGEPIVKVEEETIEHKK